MAAHTLGKIDEMPLLTQSFTLHNNGPSGWLAGSARLDAGKASKPNEDHNG